MAKKNSKIIVFYVVVFTILTAIAAGIIGLFGFGDNSVRETSNRSTYSTTTITTTEDSNVVYYTIGK